MKIFISHAHEEQKLAGEEYLHHVRGRVVMSRDRKKVEGYWDLAPGTRSS